MPKKDKSNKNQKVLNWKWINRVKGSGNLWWLNQTVSSKPGTIVTCPGDVSCVSQDSNTLGRNSQVALVNGWF